MTVNKSFGGFYQSEILYYKKINYDIKINAYRDTFCDNFYFCQPTSIVWP